MKSARLLASWLLAWVCLGVFHIIAQSALWIGTDSWVFSSWFVFDLGHFLAVGLFTGGVFWVVERTSGGKRPWRLVALTILALIAGLLLARPELEGLAHRIGQGSNIPSGLLSVALATGVSLLVPIAWFFGTKAGELRWTAWAFSIAVFVGAYLNEIVLNRANPAAHLFLAWMCAAGLAGVLYRNSVVSKLLLRFTGRRGRFSLSVAGVAALTAVLVPPPDDVRVVLDASNGSVVFPFLSEWYSLVDTEPVLPTPTDDAWLSPRVDFPDVAPTVGFSRPDAPIVLFVIIDAMRTDLMDDSRAQEWFPNLTALRGESVYFTRAYSPGVQTVYTLTSIFACKYYSQLYWTEWSDGRARDVWPHQDPTTRFPVIIQAAGIPTAAYIPTFWLVDEFGVIRGFDDNEFVAQGTSVSRRGASHWNAAQNVVEPLLERLSSHGSDPLFAFIYFIDPHEPYDTGVGASGGFDGFVAEISEVDRQLGRLLLGIEQAGLRDRTMVIVASDHGEAFGEHGTTFHATTLYEELIRVPLWIRVPGLEPSEQTTPVSLIDIGPTILDWFDLSTPGHSMGESLLPLATGLGPAPSRPIASEGRRMHSIVFSDGIKVIRNNRLGTVEVYDLNTDPNESVNLGLENALTRERAAFTVTFFWAHALSLPGYQLPNRQ